MRRILIIPGLGNSGPGHWQTRWEAILPCARRVQLHDWDDPHPLHWQAAINAAVRDADDGMILVAHSLGCIAVAHWAGRHPEAALRVGGALLVAPADVEDASAVPALRRFAPLPETELPFPAVVVASANDPYASLSRSRLIARRLGAGCISVGAQGHINAASGLGDWPFGLRLLKPFLDGRMTTRPWQPEPLGRPSVRRQRQAEVFEIGC